MRILKQGERKGRCEKCKTVFAYTEDDFRFDHEREFGMFGPYTNTYKFLVCPVCKAKIRER